MNAKNTYFLLLPLFVFASWTMNGFAQPATSVSITSIEPGKTTFCQIEPITINFSANGTFTTDNVFHAFLIKSGETPVPINSVQSDIPVPITGDIPPIAQGTGYRIKVVATDISSVLDVNDPAFVDNGFDITIKHFSLKPNIIGVSPQNATACNATITFETTAFTGTSNSTAGTYSWSLPSGAGFVPFTPEDQYIADIAFDGNFLGGTVCVKKEENGCISNEFCLEVDNKTAISKIKGEQNLCNSGLTGLNYSIPNDFDTYAWSVPGGSITSGQGTNSILVDYPVSFTSDVISVTAVNSCGATTVKDLSISKNAPDFSKIPPDQVTLEGPKMICPGSGNTIDYVFTDDGYKEFSSGSWSFTDPSNITIVSNTSSNGVYTLSVKFLSGYTGTDICFTGTNSCGSDVKCLTVGVNPGTLNVTNSDAVSQYSGLSDKNTLCVRNSQNYSPLGNNLSKTLKFDLFKIFDDPAVSISSVTTEGLTVDNSWINSGALYVQVTPMTKQEFDGLGLTNWKISAELVTGCGNTILEYYFTPHFIVMPDQTIDVNCWYDNATVNLNPMGGTAPYNFIYPGSLIWEDPTQPILDQSVGTHFYEIQDQTGCTEVSKVDINALSMFNPKLNLIGEGGTSVVDQQCDGKSYMEAAADGIYATPLTYDWLKVEPGPIYTSIGNSALAEINVEGDYKCIITDNNGCEVETGLNFVEVTDPMQVSFYETQPSCNGYSDGSLTVSVDNPSEFDGVLSVNWTGGPSGTTYGTIAAGTYEVTIADDNGCGGTFSNTLGEPDAISVSLTMSKPSCYGESDGSITISVAGGNPYTSGTPEYTTYGAYKEYSGAGATTTSLVNSRENLVAGTYSITVTDQNGCTGSQNIDVTQPAEIIAGFAGVSDATCNGYSDGNIISDASGGTGALSYQWYLNDGDMQIGDDVDDILLSGETLSDITGGVGEYYYAAADATGCLVYSGTENINEPSEITASFVFSNYNGYNISCNGGSNGWVEVAPSGGTGTKNIVWGSSGPTTQMYSGLGAGAYQVTLTDINGCAKTITTPALDEPDPLAFTKYTTGNVCTYDQTGYISVTATGGVSPYEYSWLGSTVTNPTRTNLSDGTYTARVTDDNGCFYQESFDIESTSNLTQQLISLGPDQSLCPTFCTTLQTVPDPENYEHVLWYKLTDSYRTSSWKLLTNNTDKSELCVRNNGASLTTDVNAIIRERFNLGELDLMHIPTNGIFGGKGAEYEVYKVVVIDEYGCEVEDIVVIEMYNNCLITNQDKNCCKPDIISSSQLKFDNVFPNPSIDIVNVRLINENRSPGVLELRDIVSGTVLETTDFTGMESTVKMDVSGYPSGTYLLDIRTSETMWDKTTLSIVK